MKKTIIAIILTLTMIPMSFAQTPKKEGKMELFLETMDAQGWQWFLISDAVNRRIKAASLKVYPIVSKDSKGNFTAKNGEQELDEARRIAVIGNFYSDRLRDYLTGRVFDMSGNGWKDAAVYAGINPDKLEEKVKSDNNKSLENAYARANVLNVDSSALFIDGKAFEGYQRLIGVYNAVNTSLPKSCQIPLPAGYNPPTKSALPSLWAVLGTGNKKNDQLIRVFDRWFEGIKPEYLAHDSSTVKEKFPWLVYTPSYIMPDTEDVRKILNDYINAGEFKVNSGYIVYEDRSSNGFYISKPEKENTVEMYIMSQCPYGVASGNLLFGAQKEGLLPNDFKIELHFIGNVNVNNEGVRSFSSLHGEAEWKENARQLFIANKFPDKIGDYVLERNKDVTSQDWQKAAKAAGIDAALVEAGTKEAEDMLEKDFKITDALGIGSSPSFIVNGREFFVGTSGLYNVKGLEKLSAQKTNSVPAGSCN